MDELKGKKIGILGFGIEGQATYNYLKMHGIPASIFDQKSEDEFFATHPDLGRQETSFFLGQKYLSQLSEMEVIFRSPGIPLHTAEIRQAKKKGSLVTSQTKYFFDHCQATIIGVTGTKGKGTTSTLINEILKADGKKVYLGGNIGVPALTFLDELDRDSLVILELSSFQLQDLEKSPQIGVVLNITQDHLDHHQDIHEYREAKKAIVRYQKSADKAVINADYTQTLKLGKATKAEKYYFSTKRATNGAYVNQESIYLTTSEGVIHIIKGSELLLRGMHNLENITAAITAVYLAGASIDSIRKTLKSFKGLEHRLELVATKKGVSYYNDSFSTTPEATMAAIRAFEEPIVLIIGGSSKGSDYSELGKEIESANIRAIIFIGDTAEEISSKIGRKYGGKKLFGLSKMKEIIDSAALIAKPGDIVLLSPACASFGLFSNYKDRGNQFKQRIAKISV